MIIILSFSAISATCCQEHFLCGLSKSSRGSLVSMMKACKAPTRQFQCVLIRPARKNVSRQVDNVELTLMDITSK